MKDPAAALTDDEREIAELMTFGLPSDEQLRGVEIKAGWPLTLEQAAIYVGKKCRWARNELDPKPEFSEYRRKLLEGRRKAEMARNLVTAITIRDDEGDGTAATKTVRIKAASFIQGDEKPGVVVNIGHDDEQRRDHAGVCYPAPER